MWSAPGALRGLADLVLGVSCPGCGSPRTALCAECRDALTAAPRWCAPRTACPPVRAAGPYAGRLRDLLLAFKEGGERRLGAEFGRALATACLPGLLPEAVAVVLVPVPQRRDSLLRRGHDPVRLAAEQAAGVGRCSGWEVATIPALEYTRRVRDQVGLDARQRAANLAGALRVRRAYLSRLAGRPVVVVDDVVTTGSTVAEAARALRKAGGRVLGGAVAAERM